MKVISIALILFLSLHAHAQQMGLVESNRKGVEILRKSQQAYGTPGAMDSLKLSFKMNVEKNIVPGQSLVSQAPFEPQFNYTTFLVDKPKGVEVEYRKSTIAGFLFENNIYYRPGKGINHNPLLKQYFEFNANGPVSTMTFLPQNCIAAALRAPLSVRYLREQSLGGSQVHVLTCVAGNNADQLYIDTKTNHLLRLDRIYSGVGGEELNEFHFRGGRKIGGIFIPEKTDHIVHSGIFGTTTNTYAFSDFTTDFSIDTTLFKPMDGYTPRNYSYRKNFEVRELAKDIYLLENITGTTGQWSYNILFAVMDDYILVAEAPVNSAITERVIAKIKQTAPGKPIRYVVQSHHHDDHLGGIRPYIAEGATIITTANNVDFMQKIARAHYGVSPDRLSQDPKSAVIETVKGKKHVIKDNNHEVVIYDIGPNPHANEMLIVYFPKEKLIYEADMVNKGEYPMRETGQDFLKKIKALGLQVEKIASLHGQLLEKADVEKLISTGNW